MTLRTKLVFALILAALLPMFVAVAVSILKAESRAQAQAQRRLEAARRQASVLVDRARRDAESRITQAATDFANDHSAFDSLLGASRPAAGDIARRLAEVHGLDHLEILDAGGLVLSTSRPDPGVGSRSRLADLSVHGTAVREIAPDPASGDASAPSQDGGPPDAPKPGDSGTEIIFAARRPAVRAEETLFVAGGRTINEDLMAEIAEVSGERASLIDTAGRPVLTSHPSAEGAPLLISDDVPIGDAGWRVRVSAPAGDVRETQRELLAIFAGIAPFALVSALVIGIVLAEGFSRPIRALAMRADDISAEHHEPFALPPPRNEVRRLTSSFDRMLEALSDSARSRIAAERIAAWQEVARRIAHEVKNPLSPIKLAVENLRRTRDKAPEQFDRALEEETRTILEEVESLRRLVDEFSQFARLPRPQPVAIDPREIVSQALALFAPRFEAARVLVAFDVAPGTPRSIVADPEQIGRVLKNVLANALEALAPVDDRRLFVTLRAVPGFSGGGADPGSDSDLEIEVRDTGVGFEPGVEGRMFEPYFTTRADSGGTGLGMAIAYRIVTDHGGTITARGSPRRGATITIKLPIDNRVVSG